MADSEFMSFVDLMALERLGRDAERYISIRPSYEPLLGMLGYSLWVLKFPWCCKCAGRGTCPTTFLTEVWRNSLCFRAITHLLSCLRERMHR